ncbi:hypothetical protein [Quatrionicoccus australiensis]|uniref:hypothetical protein n=1 Tax=Quatrionicoccus australiensis TaxID=138118 RepID=UPI001CF8BCF0|nr:hypothetical protein [Quatrionicoccus australiensis]
MGKILKTQRHNNQPEETAILMPYGPGGNDRRTTVEARSHHLRKHRADIWLISYQGKITPISDADISTHEQHFPGRVHQLKIPHLGKVDAIALKLRFQRQRCQANDTGIQQGFREAVSKTNQVGIYTA